MEKGAVIQVFIKMFNTDCCRILFDCEIFREISLLISLTVMDLVILFKPKLGLFIYLLHLRPK